MLCSQVISLLVGVGFSEQSSWREGMEMCWSVTHMEKPHPVFRVNQPVAVLFNALVLKLLKIKLGLTLISEDDNDHFLRCT